MPRIRVIGGEDPKWRAECDMRTLREAEQIRSDSKRHTAAKKAAVAEMKSLEKVTKPAPRNTRAKK